MINADGSGPRRLLATPRLEWPTDWSQDGRKILFTRFFFDRSTDMYTIDVDGTNVRRLTHARGDDIGGTWSPDGKRIVFTNRRSGLSHLFVMRADGRSERQLTRRNAEDFEPSWY